MERDLDRPVGEWDRHVRFEACFNFRDLGGYTTHDHREVRRGVLYRSDSLHRLSQADCIVLAGLGIRTVIDLRSDDELTEHGRVADHEARVFRHAPLEEFADDGYLRPQAEQYLALALARRRQIALVLELLADAPGPAVFHCMAGKDRTGVVAAILLAVLGVPDPTIAADYALTERSLAGAVAWASEHEPRWAAWLTRAAPSGLLDSPADVMIHFLALLRAESGTVDNYLADAGLRADAASALRDRYVV